MKKIMFNDKYGLTQAVLEGRKTMTRRIVSDGILRMAQMEVRNLGGELEERIKDHTPYCYMEEIAVAQSYRTLNENGYVAPRHLDAFCEDSAGYTNKMFVRSDLMPHSICITDIKVERLQDISFDDCLREGIEQRKAKWPAYTYHFENSYECKKIKKDGTIRLYTGGAYFTAKNAFADLIDKVSGSGTWERNPWVFAYEFELIK